MDMTTLEDIKEQLEIIRGTLKETKVPIVDSKMIKPTRKVGRPSVMTPEIITKIEQVATLDGTVEEMAMYGGIHRDTLYTYFKQNPEFSDRIHALRQSLILKARYTIVNNLDDISTAKWYLERKARKEFSSKAEVDDVPKILLVDI
jgi:hypothetical protein